MMHTCTCQNPPFYYLNYTAIELGEDSYGAEITLLTCKLCGLLWLNYLIEEPQHTKSGRWWLVNVPADKRDRISADNAREFIQLQNEGFVGGSYFESTGMTCYAPITIR